MASQKTVSSFFPEDVEALQRVFNRASLQLALAPRDVDCRERLAAIIFDIAGRGVCNEAAIGAAALRRFSALEMVDDQRVRRWALSIDAS